MATATYDLIASQTLGTAAASITFSSIAASWTDLRIVFIGTFANAGAQVYIQFNGDTGYNYYSYTQLTGSGSAAASQSNPSPTSMPLSSGVAVGGSTTIPTFATGDIFSYAGSTYKTILATSSQDHNGSGEVARAVGLWRNTAAITSVTVTPGAGNGNFNTGSIASLYGIKAA
jgi:hypothetical protein